MSKDLSLPLKSLFALSHPSGWLFCYFCSVNAFLKSGTSFFLALLFLSWGWLPVLVENSHHHEKEFCSEQHSSNTDSCHISIFHPYSKIQHCEHKQHLLPQKFHCKIDFQFHKNHAWSISFPNVLIHFQPTIVYSECNPFPSENPISSFQYQPSSRGPPNRI